MDRLRLWVLVALAIVTACGSTAVKRPRAFDHPKAVDSEPSPLKIAVNSEECRRWVDSVYASMSLKQRVGQLFIPVVDPMQVAVAKSTLKRYVANYHIGGILFSKGSIEQYATLINYAQSQADVPLMVTMDGEWGLSMRIPGTTRFPRNMSLGAITDEALLYEYGREMARQCRELGIHVNFAPALDVNSNPLNPVIGSRSFGEDPHRVSALGVAYSRGLEDGGVMSVGKHFPGHGDTSTDSHKTLPVVDHSDDVLREVDLLPFQHYIDAGMSGVMVGHLNVPALDASGTPASLSRKITTGLLRYDMGFDGMVFTDALVMKGAVGKKNTCVAALEAGADVLLSPKSLSTDFAAVLAAFKSGKIPMALLEEKCRKMLAYKYALGLSHYEPVKLDGLAERLNSPQADAVNRHLHEAMITCLSNDYDMLPIAGLSERSIAVVSPTSDTSDRFVAFCEKYADIDAYRQLPTAATAASIKKKHDVVIVAIYDDKESSRRMLQRFSDHPGTIAVFFTNPYRLRKFAHSLAKVHSVLLVGESTEPAREYAAQALFGGIAVSGRLPVNVKGIADVGDGIDLPKTRLGYAAATDEGFDVSMEARLDSLIRLGLETRAFPGCQLLVARNGNIVVDKAYGVTTRAKGGRRVTTKTIYDIASVSKALGTLPGVMKACDEGLLSLDAKASRYIEGLRNTDKKDITIKQLLYHESGLPAALDIYGLMVDTTSFTGRLLRSRPSSLYSIKVGRKAYLNNQARLRRDITSSVQSAQFPIQAASGLFVSDATMDTVRRAIYAAKLKSRIYRYSDLNFCLLMEAEEAVTHIPHDKWVAREIYEPLGAWRTLYRPLSRFSAKEIAPTERDRFLRKQVLQGYVHDETASMSGGVQGNAGLFSTAEDLAKVCQMLLNGGTYGGERLLSQQVTDEFLSSKSHKSRRGLGFDKPDLKNPDKSPTAIEATSSTIGHIGFTGTCFWVDPEHELIYVFLCNRINPTRDNRAFNELDIRPKLFSIVYQSMDR